DVEFVRQPARAAEAEAHAGAAGESVAQRLLHIRDARTLIFEYETQTFAAAVFERVDGHDSAAAVIDHVPRELARRGHDLRLLDDAEAEIDRRFPDGVPDPHDVRAPRDGH